MEITSRNAVIMVLILLGAALLVVFGIAYNTNTNQKVQSQSDKMFDQIDDTLASNIEIETPLVFQA